MSKKRFKKSKGQVLTLGDFQGDHVSSDQYNLPTSSSGANRFEDSRGGRYGDRNDRGGSRYGDRNERGGGRDEEREEPSRAEESGMWRRAGASGRSGGGGFGGGGGGGGGDMWRRDGGGGGGGSFGGDRYGNSRAFGGGDRNDRWGGSGDSRNDRFGGSSGRDDRPAHLRRLGKRNEKSSADTGRPFAALGNDSDALDAKAEAQRKKDEAAAELKRIQAKRDTDESLTQNDSVDISKLKKDKLTEAMEMKKTVTVKELTGSLEALDISDSDVSFRLGACLANSLTAETLSVDELVAQAGERKGELLVLALQQVKAGDSSATLVKVAAKATVDVASIISDNKSGDDLDAFLNKVNLFELKPVPNVQKSVMATLKDGKGPEAALTVINEAIDAKLSVSYLLEPVVNFAMKAVLEDNKNPDLSVLDKFTPLLTRCVGGVKAQQKAMVFFVGDCWFAKGKVAATCKPLFTKLHELELIPHAAFVAWKDSDQTSKSKMQVLLRIMSWIKEIEPVRPEEEEDEDEEEEFDENLGLGGYATVQSGGAATASSSAW